MDKRTFYIFTDQGPIAVQGEPFDVKIGDKLARLFIHEDSPIEGPRLSCARSGMMLGKIAPFMLADVIGGRTPAGAQGLTWIGARRLVDWLVAKHGPDRLWQVMDRAPDIAPATA